MPARMEFVSPIEALVRRHGFSHFGWAKLERPLTMDIYRQWLADGHHADMHYLEHHADMKEIPQRLAPRAQTALVIAQPYLPHPYPESNGFKARTALYAQGEDYHRHFFSALERIAQALRLDYPCHEFLCFTDSAPILERDLAYRAGLGWVGKNTCLIHPQKGSLFFLGQILMSLPAPQPALTPIKDFCGTCDRCLEVCPTGALEAPRRLNAGACIAYWTIEARGLSPQPLRTQIGDWFFGCDLCQTVCPWNEKSQGADWMRELTAGREVDGQQIEDLRWLLTASHREIQRRLHGSPLLRARPLGLKRNALVVIANARLTELQAEVELSCANENLKEVAEWTLAQLRLIR